MIPIFILQERDNDLTQKSEGTKAMPLNSKMIKWIRRAG